MLCNIAAIDEPGQARLESAYYHGMRNVREPTRGRTTTIQSKTRRGGGTMSNLGLVVGVFIAAWYMPAQASNAPNLSWSA
jgi:hypothetical protein